MGAVCPAIPGNNSNANSMRPILLTPVKKSVITGKLITYHCFCVTTQQALWEPSAL
jgi:hypothetical protein